MNEEKKKYVIGKVVTAAVALVLLAVVMYFLLRPSVPTGIYYNADLESSIAFGDGLSVTYTKGEKTYTGTAVKRGEEYRAAVSDGSEDMILTIKPFKGYVTVSDGKSLENAVFKH